MAIRSPAHRLLAQETQALLTRLDGVKPFALYDTMVPAAAPSAPALLAIQRHMAHGQRVLRQMIESYRRWLVGPQALHASAAEAQRRLTFLRLRFNAILTQFDIFADVITQRSENGTGVWLAGLDVVAADALMLPGGYYPLPPVLCYLERGFGAAIRRARTRLPGGGKNPVAIVRVPRERMVGSGVASSLVHEVGHQGSALLDLINSIRRELREMRGKTRPQDPWVTWDRWISEILADYWSVARVGVISTLGLMGVVSLPRAFVFRVNMDDPHPVPWLRVKLSCAIGGAIYPDPQWRRLADTWESFYPLAGLDPPRRRLLTMLEATMPAFVELLVNQRPESLRGATLGDATSGTDLQPNRLRGLYVAWGKSPGQLLLTRPSLALAAIGQARADGNLEAEAESHLLTRLLTHWALESTLSTSESCVTGLQPRGIALPT